MTEYSKKAHVKYHVEDCPVCHGKVTYLPATYKDGSDGPVFLRTLVTCKCGLYWRGMDKFAMFDGHGLMTDDQLQCVNTVDLQRWNALAKNHERVVHCRDCEQYDRGNLDVGRNGWCFEFQKRVRPDGYCYLGAER